MKMLLFNIHDLVLVCVVMACTLLAALSAALGQFKQFSKYLLVAFFLSNALITVDTLVFWGEGVRGKVFGLSPWLSTLFSVSLFVFGPILLWLVQTETRDSFRIKWLHTIHLLPVILTPAYLYWAYYQYPFDVQKDLILNFSIYKLPDAHYSTFVSLSKLAPVIYGCFALKLLHDISRRATQPPNFKYLIYLAAGFTLVRVWVLLTHALGIWLPIILSDTMGLVGNYLTLSLLGFLLIVSFRMLGSPTPKGPAANKEDAEEENNEHLNALAENLSQFMREEKPYLNASLTLERYAQLLKLPTRQVSNTINRCFGQSYQEYINRHRVEEAKRLLNASSTQDQTILEITQLAGFNSKATFNRLFKAATNMTPSQYRNATQSPTSPPE